MDITEALLIIFRNYRGTELSLQEIEQRLRNYMAKYDEDWPWWPYRRYHDEDRYLADVIHARLERLEQMQLIEPDSSRASELVEAGLPAWRLKGDWGGSIEPPNPPGEPAPDGEDPGPGGFREILTHPILFSVSDDDFNALLDFHLGEP